MEKRLGAGDYENPNRGKVAGQSPHEPNLLAACSVSAITFPALKNRRKYKRQVNENSESTPLKRIRIYLTASGSQISLPLIIFQLPKKEICNRQNRNG
jgi:ribosomal protein S30